MKECNVPVDTPLGYACRLTPGMTKESCYLWSEVQSEPLTTLPLLEPIVRKKLGCPFQKETLGLIKQRLAED
ncbi:MAG: hypothetical protein Q8P80_01750 [Candidatus Levybacteria bacterium]|nr:hypothetical protein [Candidatus Levybacteria bacterium]